MLRQALSTDDGRRILADALDGTARPQIPPLRYTDALPYPELGRSKDAASRPVPIFTTGRFRSGSTLLWNIFRHVPGCTSFYEPLNERRWFDPMTRGERVDATHLGVTDYWREYEGLDHLAAFYRDEWISRHLFMDASSWDPQLHAYIQGLIDAAPAHAVLQFNRVDFRLPWLRHHFPDARIIHMYRHPRDQWCSSLVDVKSFPRDGTISDFEPQDHFYLLSWARDLSFHFPFLDPRTAKHPYELFYFIWTLSFWAGRQCAHASFAFETLCESPRQELTRLLQAAGIEEYDLELLSSLVIPQKSKWAQYADQSWFESREARCDGVLREFCEVRSPSDHITVVD
jgi:Sulfotransferase family